MIKERLLRCGQRRREAGGFRRTVAAAALAVTLGAGSLAAQKAADSPLDQNMDVLGKWVEAQRALAQERADWQSEQARLHDMIAVRQAQPAQLNEALDDARKETDVAESERSQLAGSLDAMKATEATITQAVDQAEQRVRTLLPQLPLPLQQQLQPLTVRLPDPKNKSAAAHNLSTSQRMQTVVGLLTQIEKFNDTVDLNEEAREIDGRRVQVEALYFGLAAAYWVDGEGLAGGTGQPGPDGWVWTRDDSLAPRIKGMISMYRGNTTAITYVSLPANVSE
jgi:septal ring factor EnvC (AmiA/AmiB activator)